MKGLHPDDHTPEPATCRDEQRTPTREELEADISIDAAFDDVMDAIIAGHGTD